MEWQKNPLEPFSQKSLCESRWTSPVVSLDRGELRFCCHTPPRKIEEGELLAAGSQTFLNSDFDKSKRKEMLRGERPKECYKCWELEASGAPSPRSTSEEFLGQLAKSETSTQLFQAKNPKTLEIMLGNHCDLKCIYCNPYYSSRWAKELREHNELGPLGPKERQNDRPAASFDKLFWQALSTEVISHVKEISLLGGEPLLNPGLYLVLDRISEAWRASNPSDPSRGPDISIITNLNCHPSNLEKFLNKFESMSSCFRLNLNISMESIGSRAEYIRYGLKWERWLSNLIRLMESKVCDHGICFQITMNALSVTSIKSLLELLYDLVLKHRKPIYLRENTVVDPNYLSPLILSQDFSNSLFESEAFVRSVENEMRSLAREPWGDWGKFGNYLGSLANSLKVQRPILNHQREFIKFINKMDSRRELNSREIFPEYNDFFSYCLKSSDL